MDRKVVFSVRIPASFHQELKIHSASSGRDLQEITIEALQRHLAGKAKPLQHPLSCPLANGSSDEVEAVREFLTCWRAIGEDPRKGLIQIVRIFFGAARR